MNRTPSLIALLGPALLLACAGCGHTEGPVSDAGIAGDSGTDGGRRDGGIIDLDSGLPPEASVPVDAGPGFTCDAGWVPVGGLPKECQVCAWTPDAPAPPALPWRTCPALPATNGLPCEILQSAEPGVETLNPFARTSATGVVNVSAITFASNGSGGRVALQNAKSGEVVGAFLYPTPTSKHTCTSEIAAVTDDVVSTSLSLRGEDVMQVGGLIAAKRADLADARTVEVTSARPGGFPYFFTAIGTNFIRATLGQADLLDFDQAGVTQSIYNATSYGGDRGLPRDELPNGAIGTPTAKGLYWVGQKGAAPLLKVDGRRYTDGKIMSIGSDGTDIAWSRGFGLSLGTHEREHGDLWRAPFNDPDPFAHATKVLTNDAILGAEGDLVVGCGYAVFNTRYGGGGNPAAAGIGLVRLSDGRRWLFNDTVPAADPGFWQYIGPEALDCTHVYAQVATRVPPDNVIEYAMVRFKIADLGPGLAP
jgi:hypothetical protein